MSAEQRESASFIELTVVAECRPISKQRVDRYGEARSTRRLGRFFICVREPDDIGNLVLQ